MVLVADKRQWCAYLARMPVRVSGVRHCLFTGCLRVACRCGRAGLAVRVRQRAGILRDITGLQQQLLSADAGNTTTALMAELKAKQALFSVRQVRATSRWGRDVPNRCAPRDVPALQGLAVVGGT